MSLMSSMQTYDSDTMPDVSTFVLEGVPMLESPEWSEDDDMDFTGHAQQQQRQQAIIKEGMDRLHEDHLTPPMHEPHHQHDLRQSEYEDEDEDEDDVTEMSSEDGEEGEAEEMAQHRMDFNDEVNAALQQMQHMQGLWAWQNQQMAYRNFGVANDTRTESTDSSSQHLRPYHRNNAFHIVRRSRRMSATKIASAVTGEQETAQFIMNGNQQAQYEDEDEGEYEDEAGENSSQGSVADSPSSASSSSSASSGTASSGASANEDGEGTRRYVEAANYATPTDAETTEAGAEEEPQSDEESDGAEGDSEGRGSRSSTRSSGSSSSSARTTSSSSTKSSSSSSKSVQNGVKAAHDAAHSYARRDWDHSPDVDNEEDDVEAARRNTRANYRSFGAPYRRTRSTKAAHGVDHVGRQFSMLAPMRAEAESGAEPQRQQSTYAHHNTTATTNHTEEQDELDSYSVSTPLNDSLDSTQPAAAAAASSEFEKGAGASSRLKALSRSRVSTGAGHTGHHSEARISSEGHRANGGTATETLRRRPRTSPSGNEEDATEDKLSNDEINYSVESWNEQLRSHEKGEAERGGAAAGHRQHEQAVQHPLPHRFAFVAPLNGVVRQTTEEERLLERSGRSSTRPASLSGSALSPTRHTRSTLAAKSDAAHNFHVPSSLSPKYASTPVVRSRDATQVLKGGGTEATANASAAVPATTQSAGNAREGNKQDPRAVLPTPPPTPLMHDAFDVYESWMRRNFANAMATTTTTTTPMLPASAQTQDNTGRQSSAVKDSPDPSAADAAPLLRTQQNNNNNNNNSDNNGREEQGTRNHTPSSALSRSDMSPSKRSSTALPPVNRTHRAQDSASDGSSNPRAPSDVQTAGTRDAEQPPPKQTVNLPPVRQTRAGAATNGTAQGSPLGGGSARGSSTASNDHHKNSVNETRTAAKPPMAEAQFDMSLVLSLIEETRAKEEEEERLRRRGDNGALPGTRPTREVEAGQVTRGDNNAAAPASSPLPLSPQVTIKPSSSSLLGSRNAPSCPSAAPAAMSHTSTKSEPKGSSARDTTRSLVSNARQAASARTTGATSTTDSTPPLRLPELHATSSEAEVARTPSVSSHHQPQHRKSGGRAGNADALRPHPHNARPTSTTADEGRYGSDTPSIQPFLDTFGHVRVNPAERLRRSRPGVRSTSIRQRRLVLRESTVMRGPNGTMTTTSSVNSGGGGGSSSSYGGVERLSSLRVTSHEQYAPVTAAVPAHPTHRTNRPTHLNQMALYEAFYNYPVHAPASPNGAPAGRPGPTMTTAPSSTSAAAAAKDTAPLSLHRLPAHADGSSSVDGHTPSSTVTASQPMSLASTGPPSLAPNLYGTNRYISSSEMGGAYSRCPGSTRSRRLRGKLTARSRSAHKSAAAHDTVMDVYNLYAESGGVSLYETRSVLSLKNSSRRSTL